MSAHVDGTRGAELVAWRLDDVVRAAGATVERRGSATVFTGIATDTRTLAGGELFVALRGPRYDAHDLVAEAVAAGAGGVLVERPVAANGARDLTVLVCRDAVRALQDLAAAHRRRLAPRVFAITGSNGKTTTKEMLAAILAAAGGAAAVLKTSANLNNHIGVPLTLLRLTGSERDAVVEMGMNAPGEIWRLTEIADPDIAVITNVGPAHLEGLGSVAGVARAKGELFQRMRGTAVAVANADDEHVAALADAHHGRVVRFGASTEIRADAVRAGTQGAPAFTLRVGGTTCEVQLRMPGRHNVANALAAAAAAHAAGVDIAVIGAGLAAADPVGNRMRLVHLPGGVTLINDSYNANPASVAAALRCLAEAQARRRIAVLGDMLELGGTGAEHHRRIGRLAADLGVDALYLYGDYAADTAAGATGDAPEAGTVRSPAARVSNAPTPRPALAAAAVHVMGSHEAIAAAVGDAAGAGDWILVKGSRGQRMEEVVRLLGVAE